MRKNRGLKISILAFGILVIGMLLVFPAIRYLIRTSRHPNEADILSALYGSETKIQESTDGKSVFVIEPLSNIEKEQFNYASQVQTQVIYQKRGWDNNPETILVLTTTAPPDCCSQTHSSVLGGAIIREDNSSIEVIAEHKLLIPLDNFDGISGGDFVNIGPGKFGFRLQDHANLNVGLQTRDLIISLIHGRLKVVAILETHANNSVQCSAQNVDDPCWEIEASYEFLAGNHPDYYDILITTSGTRLVNGEIISIRETQKLIFDGEHYRLEKP